MTAPAPTTAAARAVPGPGEERKTRFRHLLNSEWHKLWSLRSTPSTLGLSSLGLVAINANGALADHDNWPRYSPQIKAVFFPDWAMHDAFTNNAGICLLLAAGCIGAISIAGEYSSGLVRTSFAAVPARRALIAAKVAVMTAVMLVYGAVTAAASFAITQAVLSGRHVGLSVSYPGALRVLAVSALLAPVCALTGMGIAAVVRHSATTMVAVVAILLLLPNMLTDNRRWTADIDHALPFRAWQRLNELSLHVPPDAPPFRFGTVSGSWTVYAVWPLVGVILAIALVDRRDV